MQYWDTSTLLKLYVPEPDSGQFAAHLSAPTIYTSELARWEMLRAVVRKEMEKAIPAESAEIVFHRLLSDVVAKRVVLVPLDAEIETRFRQLVLQLHRRSPPVAIRTLDAIHLATASAIPASEVVTTDSKMRDGATALGLRFFP